MNLDQTAIIPLYFREQADSILRYIDQVKPKKDICSFTYLKEVDLRIKKVINYILTHWIVSIEKREQFGLKTFPFSYPLPHLHLHEKGLSIVSSILSSIGNEDYVFICTKGSGSLQLENHHIINQEGYYRASYDDLNPFFNTMPLRVWKKIT